MRQMPKKVTISCLNDMRPMASHITKVFERLFLDKLRPLVKDFPIEPKLTLMMLLFIGGILCTNPNSHLAKSGSIVRFLKQRGNTCTQFMNIHYAIYEY